MSVGKQLTGKTVNNCIAVIGDGAITGGMAYEAMNCAGYLKQRMIVVLNDNGQVSLSLCVCVCVCVCAFLSPPPPPSLSYAHRPPCLTHSLSRFAHTRTGFAANRHAVSGRHNSRRRTLGKLLKDALLSSFP